MSANEDSYATSYATKDQQIPVQKDDEPVEDGIDASTADSDAQLRTSHLHTLHECSRRVPADTPTLERDDVEAIDESNIVDSRTRHAQPERGTYKEPGDTEGLPTDE